MQGLIATVMLAMMTKPFLNLSGSSDKLQTFLAAVFVDFPLLQAGSPVQRSEVYMTGKPGRICLRQCR